MIEGNDIEWIIFLSMSLYSPHPEHGLTNLSISLSYCVAELGVNWNIEVLNIVDLGLRTICISFKVMEKEISHFEVNIT